MEFVLPAGLLETYRPNEHFDSVAAIGREHIRGLIDSGRTLFISDIDGTIAPNGDFEISEETRSIYEEISQDAKAKLVLWTNVTGKSEDELWRMQWMAHTLGAEFVTFKDAPDEGKPGSAKIHAIIQHINENRGAEEQVITTGNTVMIGDKLTADVRAGNFAGENGDDVHTIWVNRLGGPRTDVKGDLYFRRSYEWLLWNVVLGRKSKTEKSAIENSRLSTGIASGIGALALSEGEQTHEVKPLTKNQSRVKQPKRIPVVSSQVLIDNSLIANIGAGPKVEISQKKFDTLPPPSIEPLYVALRALKNNLLLRKIENRAKEHGKQDANALTLARIASIPAVLGAITAREFAIAGALFAGSSFTDYLDGYIANIYYKYHPKAREIPAVVESSVHDASDSEINNIPARLQRVVDAIRHPRAALATAKEKIDAPGWGAKWDPKADKWLGYATGVGLAIVNPLLLSIPIAATFSRDLWRDKIQRPRYEARDYNRYDLRATTSSKFSTLALTVANAICLMNPSPLVMVTAQSIAAGTKWFSLAASPLVWSKRKAFRETAAEKRVILTRIYQDKIALQRKIS